MDQQQQQQHHQLIYLQRLLNRPFVSEIEKAVGEFLTSKLEKEFDHHITPCDDYFVSIKWSFVNLKFVHDPNPSINASLREKVENLEKLCQLFYKRILIRDKEGFLYYCYNSKTFSIQKFAMMLDKTYLTLGLLDNDKDVREFAKIVLENRKEK